MHALCNQAPALPQLKRLIVLDEEEVHLKRGDIVVQRGTNHAWSNRTDAMARMVFILLDGRYAPELLEVLA